MHTMGTAALPTILASFFITLCRHPLRLLHAAGKSLLYRWKSLETFGENLWAFLCGVHLARTLKEAGIDICYAPWPRGTTTAARTVFLLVIAKCNPEEMTDAQVADLKAAQEKLMTSAQKLFAKLYEQQGGAAGAGAGTAGAGPDMGNAGAAGGHDDDVVDADYKEV